MKRKTVFRIIIIAFITASAVMTLLYYGISLNRTINSIIDLIYSIGSYVLFIIGIKELIPARINNIPDIDISRILPYDIEELKRKLITVWSKLIEWENLQNYFIDISKKLNDFLTFILLLIPIILVMSIIIKGRIFRPIENKYRNQDTKYLRLWKKRIESPCKAVINWLQQIFIYFMGNKLYCITLPVIWLINLNIITIAVESLSFYIWFASSFKIGEIFIQLLKLIIDLIVMISGAPLIFWIIVSLFIIDKIRRYIGIQILEHNENKNKGFINSLSITVMIVGEMGKKKTTLLTDMAISQHKMFRDEAKKRMLKSVMMFPQFPFSELEADLKKQIKKHKIYNLATVEQYINDKANKYRKRKIKENCYGYDIENQRSEYNDNLKINKLFETIKTYAKLYFIYTVESSLLISNFSIREDSEKHDIGNFPLWDEDIFNRDPEIRIDKYANILDFDIMRLGNKMKENNPNIGSFEFGCLCITEIGKERGNQLELKEVKAKSDETNQKNDKLTQFLKLIRHAGTVDYFPFVRVFTDEQRPESWGADARDVAEIINIISSDDVRISMPLFVIEQIIYDWMMPKLIDFYFKMRYYREDNNLVMYLIRGIASKYWQHVTKIINQYGYSRVILETESGTLEGNKEQHEYYLANKKIYSDRFSTDAFSDMFQTAAKETTTGINDYEKYKSIKATVQEMQKQNSHFMNETMGLLRVINYQNGQAEPSAEAASRRAGSAVTPQKQKEIDFTF